MDSSRIKTVGTLIKRNLVSVVLPSFVIFTIYADLRHTARWKQQLLAEQQKQ